MFNFLGLFSFCSTCWQTPPQPLAAFPVPAPEQLNVTGKKENHTIMLIGPTLIHEHGLHIRSQLCLAILPHFTRLFSPQLPNAAVSLLSPSQAIVPVLTLSRWPCSLFRRENRKDPLQSSHDQVYHLSRVCTRVSALRLVSLRYDLRANLMFRIPSSVSYLRILLLWWMIFHVYFFPFLLKHFYQHINMQ